jgi:hypothetical protein
MLYLLSGSYFFFWKLKSTVPFIFFFTPHKEIKTFRALEVYSPPINVMLCDMRIQTYETLILLNMMIHRNISMKKQIKFSLIFHTKHLHHITLCIHQVIRKKKSLENFLWSFSSCNPTYSIQELVFVL